MKIKYCLLLVTLAIFNTYTKADQTSNYNPSGCRADFFEDYLDSGMGGYLANRNTEHKILVTCPVVKTLIKGQIESAWIEIIDASESEDIVCYLTSRASGFGREPGFSESEMKKSSGFSYKPQKLIYGNLHSKANGTYFISCYIPKNSADGSGSSKIIAYSVTERE